MCAPNQQSPASSWTGPERRKDQPITIDWRIEVAAILLFFFGCGGFVLLAPYLPAIGRWIAP